MFFAFRDTSRQPGRCGMSLHVRLPPVHCRTPVGGLGPMPIASNRSGYERLGGPSIFAVAPLDALCSAIHHSRGRVWFGPRARQSLENVENRFS